MPVEAYANEQAEGRTIAGVMTPDKLAGLLVELAEEGLRIAESNRQAATRNRDEAARFVTDSQSFSSHREGLAAEGAGGNRQAVFPEDGR